jgi:hypothetical protein
MIHKFILERCVQCNLPMAELEGAGWDCKGHSEKAASDEALWDLDGDSLPELDASPDTFPVTLHPDAGTDGVRRRSLPKLPPIDYARPLPQVRVEVEEPPTTTDICAIGSFATGILGFWIYPFVLAPVAVILSIISRQRLKDNSNLKGTGYRIVGGLLGAASVVYLLAGMGFYDQNRRTVDRYLANTVAGNAPYEVLGVSNYQIVDYEIEKSSGGLVTAKLTFKNGFGHDMIQTHNFRVNKRRQVELLSGR